MSVLRYFCRPPRFRALSTSSGVSRLTRNDVDFISNPEGEYFDGFWEAYGKHRTVFKKSDIALWQDSFEYSYIFKSMCLKGTTKTIAVAHVCDFHPINPTTRPITFMGFGWIDPEYRAAGVAPILNRMCMEEVQGPNVNLVSHINVAGRHFWDMMCKTPRHPDIGSSACEVGYLSVYKSEDIQIPNSLDFSDITVKCAREVPKKDIVAYDQQIHPFRREKYMTSHLHDSDGFSKVAYDEDGDVCGIAQAVIYPKGDCNLGPFYADSPHVAQAMFAQILRDIEQSGKKVTQFEVRSGQLCKDSYTWIFPFLKCKPSRTHICNMVFRHWAPENVDYSKVYVQTHAPLFVV